MTYTSLSSKFERKKIRDTNFSKQLNFVDVLLNVDWSSRVLGQYFYLKKHVIIKTYETPLYFALLSLNVVINFDYVYTNTTIDQGLALFRITKHVFWSFWNQLRTWKDYVNNNNRSDKNVLFNEFQLYVLKEISRVQSLGKIYTTQGA